MFISEIQIRVRYAETDQMGFVYYGNYATYFEVARVELIRSLGFSYKEIEESGIILPVLDYSIKYLKPAKYDDLITIKCTIPELPSVRIKFQYECRSAEGILLNEAVTNLAFLKATNNKPCHPPAGFIEKLMPYFKV